jgi:hypothetical protein
VVVTGLKSTVGIIKVPAVVDVGTGKEFKFLSGTSGAVQSVTEKGALPPPPPPPPAVIPATGSRTSWKELI